ncbi:MAG: PD-(D/E)XK nuclease family transposase [Lachnospiraceae bacterium]|nr:PD-(D/E)XK nuclease family transposase [Lachnospiraceae bacterium]
MTEKVLRDFFTDLPTEQELRERIERRDDLQGLFATWDEKAQQRYLDICTGKRGFRILYDSYFKEVMNPEYDPSRMESFLETVIGEPVKIVNVLPNDSVRLDDENTLLVTDIIVELQGGSIANIEVQKIGYMFTGPRCSCYLSDMMLRQYRRIRARKSEPFSYRKIKKVYLIVLYENSPQELKEMPDTYLHRAKHVFDTGLQMDLLQRCILIPLDIFKKCMQNKAIRTLQEAWLTFLSEDDPGRVAELLQSFPEFIGMYKTLYGMSKDMVRMMGFFSEELRMMDKDTVQYMIDEQQKIIDQNRVRLEEKEKTIESQQARLEEREKTIENQQARLEEKEKTIESQQARLEEREKTIESQQAKLEENQAAIEELQALIKEQNQFIEQLQQKKE